MMSLQAIAAMTGAQLNGDPTAIVSRISTDTRDLRSGDLFVALRGETFDGHDFIEAAGAAGAVAALVVRGAVPSTLATVRVDDTRRALGQIAAGWRLRHSLPLIAVTGSNGKTTVKEMIAAILAAQHGADARLATIGNLNNEIGVPRTLLRMSAAHASGVVELGMNHPGEIVELARMTAPTVALVNNAQREHQEFMSSVEAVARENGAVFTQLPSTGTAVFPHGTPWDPIWRDLAGPRATLTFGLESGADVSGSWSVDDRGVSLDVRGAVTINGLRLSVLGRHNAVNALAATACASAAGIGVDAIRRGLEGFSAVAGRLQVKHRSDGSLLIDDTYNANPDSVRAAIDVLADFPHPTCLVLGDMGEVGDEGPRFHAEIGAYARERRITRLVALGDAMSAAVDAFGDRAIHVSSHRQAAEQIGHSSVVLVKGSRFMRMERVVAHLTGEAVAGAH
ncbi:UDP-N-acetylmuramoyl-tripeptide--D-alanyl-D-alanine ligase [soil metagenome]